MFAGNLLVVWSLSAAVQSAVSPPSPAPTPKPSACAQALAAGATGAATEMCLGEEDVRRGDAAAKASVERSRLWESAIQHYRKAESLARDPIVKARALDLIAPLYDSQHLDNFRQMEQVLRELIALQPNELAPVFKLAKLLEDRGLLDAAEDTLLGARREKPDAVEPYQMLAQFYARRTTAMRQVGDAQKPATPPAAAGERDENGVYRVGGPIVMPQRLDRAVYPPEALAAGIEGVVIAEVVVNESGDVADAKVVRSIPLLDDEALRTVRNWHFKPTLVNGQPVPIRMTVTVNFTTR